MWEEIFKKSIPELKKMKFSKESIKFLMDMRTKKFDKKIVSFLQRCSVTDYIQLSIGFSNVYVTFDGFVKQIQELQEELQELQGKE